VRILKSTIDCFIVSLLCCFLSSARQNGAKSEDFLPKSRHKFTRAKQIQQSIPMARNQEKANVRRFTIKCCLLSLFFLFLERSLLS